MTVSISASGRYSVTAEMDGSTLIMQEKDEKIFSDLSDICVWNDNYRKYYVYPSVYEMPSTDGRYHFKFIPETPIPERLKNIEAAITELYELIIGG